MNFFIKFKRFLPITLLPVVSYGLLGPLEIYAGNQKDFAFYYTDFIGWFIGISAIVWVLMSVILAVLPGKMGELFGALLFALGGASYIQNMFMNIKLSEVDGGPMQWEELGGFPIINAVIWVGFIIAVLCIYWLVPKYWKVISMAGAGFLSAIQLVAVVSLIITMPPEEKDISLNVSGEQQYMVAPDDNIIVFVLDTLGDVRLEEMLKIYPDALDGLEDFTFYNNADCHYYCTFPSMTHFLTGEDFDFTMNSWDWLAQAWRSERANSFWDELHSEGYSCNLFSSEIGYVYGDISNLSGMFDNVKPIETTIDTKKLIGLLAKMSANRYAHYLLKHGLDVLTNEFEDVVGYRDEKEIVVDNGLFYKALLENGLTIDNSMEKGFIIEHLVGLHTPYTLDANANIVNEATAVEVAKGLTVVVNEYIQQLKRLGVYDQATIIITADHGAWHGGDTQPVFFIKRSGDTHEHVQINEAPISLDDFQATILDILGKDYSEYGSSIYDWTAGDIRERTVYMRVNDEKYPAVEGSSFNVYYQYNYRTDREELNRKVEAGPENILPATPW